MKNKIISYAIIFIVLMVSINIDFTQLNKNNNTESNNIVITEQIIENEEELEKIEEEPITVEQPVSQPVQEKISTPPVTSRGGNEQREKINLGTYTLTAYCACAKCCGKTDGITASGTKATAGRTIAAPSNFAFGTKLEINGKVYTVEDRGGAIQGKRLDVYFDSHQEALNFGRKTAVVYKISK